ncbi:Eco57I restriction-modification methylase domain-containing protein [Streptomyces poriferorum]|uniref:site-specific DNA-methyltransferase (adenine-specific) n=1 Tax=Streptomyces poriferorum TaxID=2798799 RepID=A0ABY9ILW5_9ACTN|nr:MULTISPECIES: DNA methyltransferase [unclassified Streptomyces]MDP5315550.1 class I SAM-dependent DNA methyltransferase [Streptomyces sp. Alt4]WLQ55601.1 class I SAM-dependent DNA methyltransferase [Streptomyces sp. Alt2]
MTFDSLINEREYFPSFYLDDVLPKQLASGPLKQWSARERQGEATPRQNLRDLTRPYMDVRAVLAPDAEKYNGLPYAPAVAAQAAAAAVLKAVGPDTEPPAFQPLQEPEAEADSTPEGEWRGALAGWHERLLKALEFVPRPGHFTARTPTGPIAVPVAHSEPGVVVLTGGFAEDLDATRGDGPANLLAAPVRLSASKTLTTVRELASWVLNADNAPRYALLLFGGVLILADKQQFSRGRYLAVNLDTALPRKAAKGARANEIDLIAAVFAASSLRPAEDGSDDEIAKLVAESRDHSVGVTAELRVGLQKSVQLIANEVLGRARTEFGVHPDDLPEWLPGALPEHGDLPRLLTEESLRYLYRILFLLYAEARPELDILPVKSEAYASGYSVARLRELVVQEKLGSASRDGFHFHESLSLLFEKVFSGHPVANTVTDRSAPVEEAPELAEDDGHESVRIEALRSRLFDPASIKLVGQRIDYPEPTRRDGSPAPATPLDLRLRNKVLHQVLRHLTLVEGKGKGRGGFISYANLSINHLGAVYEGLMSYTGFIAEKPMYEVAKGGNPEGGSWLITTDQVRSRLYSDAPGDSVFVKEDAVNPETGVPDSVVHEVGSYVYRLAGRDRQTSASYYTPESLTRATVEQTLRFRLDDEGRIDPREPEKSGVTAAEVLRWRVCEPALGSGAFLNEAVNQLAELYLKLAQKERGEQIDPEEYPREFQKAKAYIALHNAYGVDLNRTAVELAEISLWLNTMYPGMRAPWYGLHLHRGNSLIGAARKVYPGKSLGDGGWLKSSGRQAPKAVPLTEALGGSGVHRPVHQFLLPALGWGSVGDSVSVRKATGKSVVAGAVAEWLDPSLIEAMRKWRSAMRRAPKGEKRASASVSASASGKAATSQATVLKREERTGQGALDLGLDIWEQSGFDFAAASAADAAPAPAPAKRVASSAAGTNADDGSYGQTGRLRALAERVEYLWGLVRLRLELSEQEISRDIPVWGAEGDGKRSAPVMDREAVLEALEAPGSPYWRLKQVMDAWCALWFWPLEEVALLDGTAPDYFNGAQDLKKLGKGAMDRKVALRNLDEWIEFAESVVGRVDVEPGKVAGSLFEMPKVNGLKGLDAFERSLDDKMTEISGWVDFLSLGDLFPWHGTAVRIARERGFLHWELDFAHVFAGGGFDLMVGNPPWVRQEWDESGVLAELEPWFELSGKATEKDRTERSAELLRDARNRSFYLGELETVAGVSSFLASPGTYPELVGTRPDMYRAFMLLAWRAVGKRGTAGLIHPSTHLTGAKEGTLRRAAYRHLRLHAGFVNELFLFARPVGNSSHFSINVYGSEQEVRFHHANWLMHPHVLTHSVRHEGSDDTIPGIKYQGAWDLRPHQSRIITVTRSTLSEWRKLTEKETSAPIEEARALFPVTTAEEAAILALARWPHRLASMSPRVSSGFNEKTDRAAGHFAWSPGRVKAWSDVILQGPMISVATPFHKQAPEGGSRSVRDYSAWDLANLSEDATPRTNYHPAGTSSRFTAAQEGWVDRSRLRQLHGDPAAVAAAEQDIRAADARGNEESCESAVSALLRAASTHPYSEFTRVAWRRQIASDTERSLYAVLLPSGPVHVDLMNSMSLANNLETTLAAGFMAALPLDYYLRVTGWGDLRIGEAKTLPAPAAAHPLSLPLLLRTLRLNAQTNAYAPLWVELYDSTWQQDTWAAATRWPDDTPPLAEGVGPTWTRDTPLRAEFARRAALVEIDALVAVWLGISADELVAMYRARFPVLQQYEENMWFDATGRRIAKAHQQHGYGQPKDAWKQLSSHEDFPLEANVPHEYEGPLYQANRVEEMRGAHAEFTRRMRAVGWEPGDTEPPESTEQ